MIQLQTLRFHSPYNYLSSKSCCTQFSRLFHPFHPTTRGSHLVAPPPTTDFWAEPSCHRAGHLGGHIAKSIAGSLTDSPPVTIILFPIGSRAYFCRTRKIITVERRLFAIRAVVLAAQTHNQRLTSSNTGRVPSMMTVTADPTAPSSRSARKTHRVCTSRALIQPCEIPHLSVAKSILLRTQQSQIIIRQWFRLHPPYAPTL